MLAEAVTVCALSARLLFRFTLYQEQEKLGSTAGIGEQEWIKKFGLNRRLKGVCKASLPLESRLILQIF